MTRLADLSLVQAVKLASVAQHAAEHLAMFRINPPAALFDEAALQSLLVDPDVRAVLDDPANAVLLPVRRRGPFDRDPAARA